MELCGMTTVYARTTPIVLARVLNENGEYITRSMVSLVLFNLYELRTTKIPITQYSDMVLLKDQVIFDTLQKSPLWTEDDIGYNFKHAFTYSESWPLNVPGKQFLLEFDIRLTSGVNVVLGRRVRTI